jgi:hypothetical protein
LLELLSVSYKLEGQQGGLGILHTKDNARKLPMTKTLDVISETVRNPKHPFRKTDHLPKKPLKNRYERRKIKSYLQLGELLVEEPG